MVDPTVSIDIRRALEKRLAATVTGTAVAYENSTYKPVIGTKYIRATVSPFNREKAAIGPSSDSYYQGLFLVDVFIPENKAAFDAEQLADIIIEAFEAGEILTENGKNIRIRKSYRDQGVKEAPWFFVPVIIEYYAYI